MKKYNIILDLDQTLISSELPSKISRFNPKINSFDYEFLDDTYVVFARPYLQDFLDFLFKNFNVSIWTAASKNYALFVIDKFILRGSRKLDFIFFSYHCEISQRLRNEPKCISILWDVFGLRNYNESNTVIVDDNHSVFKNQTCNCFHIKPFFFFQKNSEDDDTLLTLVKKLKNLINSNGGSLLCPTNILKK